MLLAPHRQRTRLDSWFASGSYVGPSTRSVPHIIGSSYLKSRMVASCGRLAHALLLSAVLASGGGVPLAADRASDPIFDDPVPSYTTETCASVIAIAGSPDRSMQQENGGDIFDNGEEFVCELAASGLTVPIVGTDDQIEEMRRLLNSGRLVSSETTIGVADNFLADGDSVFLPSGGIVIEPRKDLVDESDSLSVESTRRRNLRAIRDDQSRPDRRRATTVYEGDKPILVVRVRDSQGRAHLDSPAVMSDKVFGTNGDRVNLSSQFESCSFGKVRVTTDYSVDISRHLASPGVIEVDLPISLASSGRAEVRSASIKATQDKLGFRLPGPFHHVMFVVERCYVECGYAGYAYVNSWLSLYQGDNYKFPGVQFHELGHNLNLAHSGGLDGETYTDHTCSMGNPFYDDEEGVMCFNAAKNFQLSRNKAWYDDNNFDVRVWNSGVTGETSWSGRIVGIADYEHPNRNEHPVVVKLESGTPRDLFLGFNRASGINRQVVDGRDKVVVYEALSDGLSYSQSHIKSILSNGQECTISNWRDSGLDLEIKVTNISNTDPAFAEVLVNFGNPKPTPPPSLPPTRVPSPLPISVPTKGFWNDETSRPTGDGFWNVGKCGNAVCDNDETATSCAVDCTENRLETTFDFDLGSGGAMFTILAQRNIEVNALSINSMSHGDGTVTVYSRPGGYEGHTDSDEGWTLVLDKSGIYHQRRGSKTEIGAFDQSITVPAGTNQSFFVSSTRGLVYKAGSVEGGVFSRNDALSILEGIGTDETFSGTLYSPRVWSGSVEYDVIGTACGDMICEVGEDSETCPEDCAGRVLETSFDFKLGSSGQMFTVESTRDIQINSLSINAMTKGMGSVKVYTRNGTYKGHEASRDGWTLIYDSVVIHASRGKETQLGHFSTPAFVKKHTALSFFVISSNGLVYKEGSIESIPIVSDQVLTILEGIGTTGEFSMPVFSPRPWGGRIVYDVHDLDSCGNGVCDIEENAQSCPSDCAFRVLETTLEFSLGSSGSMFSVQAKRSVSIAALTINAMKSGASHVKVYTRSGTYKDYEKSSVGWELIYDNPDVMHSVRGVPTNLGPFKPTRIGIGSYQSFFVISDNGLVYQRGTEEGSVFVEDEGLAIQEGIGVTGEFSGDLHTPRVFGGQVIYSIDR